MALLELLLLLLLPQQVLLSVRQAWVQVLWGLSVCLVVWPQVQLMQQQLTVLMRPAAHHGAGGVGWLVARTPVGAAAAPALTPPAAAAAAARDSSSRSRQGRVMSTMQQQQLLVVVVVVVPQMCLLWMVWIPTCLRLSPAPPAGTNSLPHRRSSQQSWPGWHLQTLQQHGS